MLSPGRALFSGWWSPLQVGAHCSVHGRFCFLRQLLSPIFLQLGIQLCYGDCSATGKSLFQNNRWEPGATGAPLLGSGMEGVGSTGGRVGRWGLGGMGQDRGALAIRVGVGAGGPQVKTHESMVQGGTWAPRALFQAGSSGSSTGGSAPPGTA